MAAESSNARTGKGVPEAEEDLKLDEEKAHAGSKQKMKKKVGAGSKQKMKKKVNAGSKQKMKKEEVLPTPCPTPLGYRSGWWRAMRGGREEDEEEGAMVGKGLRRLSRGNPPSPRPTNPSLVRILNS